MNSIDNLILNLNNKPHAKIIEIQDDMSPISKKERERLLTQNTPRQSAVMVLLHYINKQLSFTCIQRSIYNGVHSGQISLPGGKHESTDKSYIQTAIRECKEEINVNILQSEIIGKLESIYVPPSNFIIHPYVAFTNRDLIFTKDQREVSEIIHCSVSELKKENKRQGMVEINSKIKSYFINGKVIWGATATILSELELLMRHRTN